MLKSASPRQWICAKCTRRQLHIRRNHAQARLVESADHHLRLPRASSVVEHNTSESQKDDRVLRQIFDSPPFWNEYSQSSKSGKNHGLFQNRYLTSPQGFEQFASSGLHKAQRLVAKVLAASKPNEYQDVVKDLDRLSDLLCRVIDLSDFVRATHPDPRIQAAAGQAHSTMLEYMNVLNTTTGLATQLNIAIKQALASNVWSEEETTVANILKKDFAKSAVDRSKDDRERFVQVSQEISEVGQDFVDNMAPRKNYLSFPSSKMKGMDPLLARKLTSWGQIKLPSIGGSASVALRSVQDEEIRRELFMASRSSSAKTINKLDSLLRKRAELARLSDFESYAHLALEDKMAKSPESVNGFLTALSQDNSSLVQSEIAQLLDAKVQLTHESHPILQPWDKEFYMNQILSSIRSRIRTSDFLSSYFSLGRVMQGLSRLFTRLYGVRFVPHETLPGETWNSDVRRLDVISETDGHVAVLYCDLFSRPGKSPNPAHFTLRCSRLIPSTEISEYASSPSSLFASPIEAANDGMAISAPLSDGSVMQLPTIALICDFTTNSKIATSGSQTTTSKPSLLSFSELTTLFHEMGHAIHSILGRTRLQNVSGTRCATDFAELPSVLMEHFAADESVLALFATHYETDKPLPYELVREKLALDKRFEGADTENQILLSLLDQAYHSHLPLESGFNSTEIYHQIQRTHGRLPPDPPGTSWQGFFGHLYGYGGSYYSYLFDRVLARRIWDRVFRDGKDGGGVDRINGESFGKEVLRWGGSRDPWKSLASVLGGEDAIVEAGGERAMGIVGSWGVEGRRGT